MSATTSKKQSRKSGNTKANTSERNSKSKSQKPLPDFLDFRSPVAGRIALTEIVGLYWRGKIKSPKLRDIGYIAEKILAFLRLEKEVAFEKQIETLKSDIEEIKRALGERSGKLKVVK